MHISQSKNALLLNFNFFSVGAAGGEGGKGGKGGRGGTAGQGGFQGSLEVNDEELRNGTKQVRLKCGKSIHLDGSRGSKLL